MLTIVEIIFPACIMSPNGLWAVHNPAEGLERRGSGGARCLDSDRLPRTPPVSLRTPEERTLRPYLAADCAHPRGLPQISGSRSEGMAQPVPLLFRGQPGYARDPGGPCTKTSLGQAGRRRGDRARARHLDLDDYAREPPRRSMAPKADGRVTPELWAKIEGLYDELADLPGAERQARLDGVADADLRREVASLISSGSLRTEVAAAVRDTAGAVAQPALQRFGPWRTTGVLGHGGMGTVYTAVRADHAFDKQVAIKVLHLGA